MPRVLIIRYHIGHVFCGRMVFMLKIDWQESAAVIFCIMAAVLGGWFFLKYLLGIMLPFIVAWVVAMAVAPSAGWLSKKTGISKKTCSVVLLVIFLGIIISLLVLLARRLIFESGRLLEWLRYGGGAIISDGFCGAAEFVSGIGRRLPIIGEAFGFDEVGDYIGYLDDMFVNFLYDAAGKLSQWLSGMFFGVVSKLPGALMTLIVTVVACFYFTLEIGSLNRLMLSFFPRSAAEGITGLRGRMYNAVGRWLRAYIILFAITAFELFLGFIVLGVDYPVLLALIGAVIDILPIFGTGTMLIPWGLYALAVHDFRLGFGLLILYAVTVIVRQIAEPKVLGESLGIHPLLTLAALYTGYRLFGVIGMVALPPVLMMISGIFIAKKKTKS